MLTADEFDVILLSLKVALVSVVSAQPAGAGLCVSAGAQFVSGKTFTLMRLFIRHWCCRRW